MKFQHEKTKLSSLFPFASGLSLVALLALTGFTAQSSATLSWPTKHEFESSWSDYASKAAGCGEMKNGKCVKQDFEVQPNCKPVKYDAPAGHYRGTVVLFTGFTNCPEEYYQLGSALQKEGYTVLLPLLPGHGHMPISEKEDDLSALPTDQQAYEDLITQMNSLMKLARPGEKLLGGHSVGGGVAFRALEVEPTLYDRAIMFAPFVEIAGALGNVPNSVLHSGTGITWWWSSGLTPSTDCRDKINAHQSNEGYCSFHFANLAAVRDLGSAAVEDAAKIVTPFQIVGVSPDTSADNERALEIMENSGSFHGHAQACYLKGIPHAFLDALLPDHHWLGGVVKNSVNWLVRGTPYPLSGEEDPTEQDLPYCAQ